MLSWFHFHILEGDLLAFLMQYMIFLEYTVQMSFLGVNFIIGVNELSSISHYWDWSNTIGNAGIQNVFTCSHFQHILQNLHFTNSAGHTDKAHKVLPLVTQ